MKIDIEKIEKANLTIEKALVFVYMEYIRRKMKYPGEAPNANLFIELAEEGYLNVNTDGYTISTVGFQLFRDITGLPLLKLKGIPDSNFKEFWEEFPSNDAHGNWRRTRSLKSDKSGSKALYDTLIKNGVKHDDIIAALRWQIADFKKNSIYNNRMSYMKNSATWLRRKEYEIIMESMIEEDSNDDQNWTQELV